MELSLASFLESSCRDGRAGTTRVPSYSLTAFSAPAWVWGWNVAGNTRTRGASQGWQSNEPGRFAPECAVEPGLGLPRRLSQGEKPPVFPLVLRALRPALLAGSAGRSRLPK